MPEAISPNTPSRRAAILGAGALFAGATIAALPAAAANPDAELLRLCTAFHEAGKVMMAEYATGIDNEPGNSVDQAHKAYWAAIHAIVPVRANSVAGLAAKARVLQTDVANTAGEHGYEGDPPYRPLVESLLADCIAMSEGGRP